LKIKRIIWFEEIVEKLERKHHVQPEEVKEVFLDHPKFRFVERGHRFEEHVYAAIGRTNDGRYLIVFFVYRQDKTIIILSARDMTPTERKKYEQK
jgi:uncharacterized DUF497 family protein